MFNKPHNTKTPSVELDALNNVTNGAGEIPHPCLKVRRLKDGEGKHYRDLKKKWQVKGGIK